MNNEHTASPFPSALPNTHPHALPHAQPDAQPLPLTLDLALDQPTAATPTHRVLSVAGMFGLGLDAARTIRVLPPFQLRLDPASVVFVTGPSGSGKSSVLRLARERLRDRPGLLTLCLGDLGPSPDAALVDALDALPLPQALDALSRAGLGDAFVMLRRPRELSDGQRFRFEIARAMALAAQPGPHRAVVLLADEFASTLDRVTARVIAAQLSRWVRATRDSSAPVCLLAASAHDDLLESLQPDTLIFKDLGERLELLHRAAPAPAPPEAPADAP